MNQPCVFIIPNASVLQKRHPILLSTLNCFYYIEDFRYFTCLFLDNFEDFPTLALLIGIFLGILEPPILSYFKTIKCYSNSSYLRGFKTTKTWREKNIYNFFAASPWDKDISKILIWFTYTKNQGCYVNYTLRKYLSTSLKPENKADNSDFIKFGLKIGTVQDLQELPSHFFLLPWVSLF